MFSFLSVELSSLVVVVVIVKALFLDGNHVTWIFLLSFTNDSKKLVYLYLKCLR